MMDGADFSICVELGRIGAFDAHAKRHSMLRCNTTAENSVSKLTKRPFL
jgi:hypothetical protein